MKRIYIVRHAKSSWADLSMTDHDRPLNSRGKDDAPEMARRCAERGYVPDRIISSDAKRARQTAYAFKKVMRISDDHFALDPKLYHAPEESYYDALSGYEEGVASVMMFGHNPGITYLANAVSERYIDNVPTCGVLVIDSNALDWQSVAPENCDLIAFHYPKESI